MEDVILAYDFMLPILFEKYSSPQTIEYRIPKEIDNTFATTRQRMRALRTALDMVHERQRLYREIRAYEQDIAMAGNWGSSSVLLSKDMLKNIASDIEERRKALLKNIEILKKEISKLEDEARHKIRLNLIEENYL